MTSATARRGVDRVHAGDGVLYFSRLISRAAESRLPRIISTPAYQNMTIRNWNTTTRLVGLMTGPVPHAPGRRWLRGHARRSPQHHADPAGAVESSVSRMTRARSSRANGLPMKCADRVNTDCLSASLSVWPDM